MKSTTQKTVMTALLAALVCVATMIIKIPSPLLKGYLNLGDSIVLLSGWILPPVYGFLAAGIGSALADVLSGYAVYAPVTFVIKGLMALCAGYIYTKLLKKMKEPFSRIISGVISEVIMVLGYYIFEGILYGFIASAINIPANSIQGIVGIVIGLVMVRIFEKNKFIMK